MKVIKMRATVVEELKVHTAPGPGIGSEQLASTQVTAASQSSDVISPRIHRRMTVPMRIIRYVQNLSHFFQIGIGIRADEHTQAQNADTRTLRGSKKHR